MFYVTEIIATSRVSVDTGEWVDVSWTVDRIITLIVNKDIVSVQWKEYTYIKPINNTVKVVVGAQLYTSGW